MGETLKKLGVALAAGAVAALGTALGTFAADAIKARWAPPAPPPAAPPPPARRNRKAVRRG